jgi:hypothetical protein
MLLSQERVAEMSGLSVRTVQRLEAGHRVSYASLRALAVAFKVDADALEQEFYAVSQCKGEFVEIPRWVRRLHDLLWVGGPRWSRREFLVVEASCLVLAAIAFGVSLLLRRDPRAPAIYLIAIVPVGCCYLVAVCIRMKDRYQLWPGSVNALPQRPRTWRTITADYTLAFGAGILVPLLVIWLVL